MGVVSLGVGPLNAPWLVEGVTRDDGLTLTRLWLDDALPGNSEYRLLGIVVRTLRRFTKAEFVVSYADPSAGHVGTILPGGQVALHGDERNQLLMNVGHGVPRHLCSVDSAFGVHSVAYFRRHGVPVRFVPAVPKHRYFVLSIRRGESGCAFQCCPTPRGRALRIGGTDEGLPGAGHLHRPLCPCSGG